MTTANARGLSPLFVVFAAVSWALSSGCALVTDLNGDPYRMVQAEGGASEGGTCTGDATCPSFSVSCLSASECPGTGQVCCLTPISLTSAALACVATTACGGEDSLSFPLCTTAADCPSGGSCSAQVCTGASTSITIHACTKIPTCKVP